MLNLAWIPLIMVLQQQPPQDSAYAIQQIRQFIKLHYLFYAPFGAKGPPYPNMPTWWVPAPRRPTSGSCQGNSLTECMGGDWRCRVGVDCTSPEENKRLRTLIDEVERLAPLARGSDLVFRQRVALAIKNGELDRANQIAGSCYGVEWWCKALRGLIAHRLRPGHGLTSFDSALALAPPSIACAWRDPSPVAQSGFLRASASWCDGTDSSQRRFWWLADPLWSQPGNDRYAEHLARHVMEQMDRDIYPEWVETCDQTEYMAQGIPNSRRVREVRVPASPGARYALWWARCTTPRANIVLSPAQRDWVLSSDYSFRKDYRAQEIWYVNGGYSFVPDSARLRAPLTSTSADWAVQRGRGHERLVTAQNWFNLEPQIAVFRRGAQYYVTTAAALPSAIDTATGLQTFLVLGRIVDQSLSVSAARLDDHRTFRASMSVDSGGYLASIEVVGRTAVARARLGAPAQPLVKGFGLSDIALMNERFEIDRMSLQDALLPAATVQRAGHVGVYFEVYGVSEEDTIEVELTSQSAGRTLLQSFLSSLGVKLKQPLRVGWQESVEEGPILRRFFLLDASTLPAGESVLKLTVRRSDGSVATVTKAVRREE